MNRSMQVRENVDMVKAISKRNKGGEFDFAVGPEEQAMLWSARKEALWSMLALRREGDEVWSTDVAVPLSRLPDIIGTQIRHCINKCHTLNVAQKFLRRKWII
jgi:FAD/FMN-containing dehydrogenase